MGIMTAVLYVIVRTILFITSDYPLIEKVLALALLLAEIFLLTHGIGYFSEILIVAIRRKSLSSVVNREQPPSSWPPIAVVVSSYKEPLEILEKTLTCFYNMTYPNKSIYFLDDTRYDLPGLDAAQMAKYRQDIDAMCRNLGANVFRRRWHDAKAGMINDFLSFLRGQVKEGFEFIPSGNTQYKGQEKYIAVFDADMNAFPNFAEPLVTMMESRPKLAFVQTPQYYTNFEHNRIARASGLLQVVFYEYICEGKDLRNAMFCCGTNVLFRIEALNDVGGFDESSVTEDFATSLKLHLGGWESAYNSKPSVFGMGPEDLGAYFKQQFRWALGTTGLLCNVVRKFLRNRKALPLAVWWEYLLSSSFYLIGIVYLIFQICPLLFLFFNMPSYLAAPKVYAAVFIPYIMLTLSLFFWSLGIRGYFFSDLVQGQLLMSISFPVYIKAAISGLFGVRGKFVVTTKGKTNTMSLRTVWVQIAFLVFNFAAISWGFNRLYYERELVAAIMINMFWCLYNFLFLTSIFYFMRRQE